MGTSPAAEPGPEEGYDMTKKHFKAVAAAINAHVFVLKALNNSAGLAAVRALTKSLAVEFADFNPRFDRDRFLAACGIEE